MLDEDNTLLTERETAELLKVSPRTLAAWRQRRRGPRVVKFARNSVRYRRADVLDFIQACGGGWRPHAQLGGSGACVFDLEAEQADYGWVDVVHLQPPDCGDCRERELPVGRE
jgi:predicted DNA-binding transcriptional regulator AlpA